MDATKILSKTEVATVLQDLQQKVKKARKSLNARLNLTLFRLSCCCGLRCMELTGLSMKDIKFDAQGVPLEFPCIRVRKAITKGQEAKKKGRMVPLWWDSGTREDIKRWYEIRLEMGAGKEDPFLCSIRGQQFGKRLTRKGAGKRWLSATRAIGSRVSIHKGRHTFCTLSLDAGRSLAEVRDAAGHSGIGSTNIYLHCIPRDNVRDVFAFDEK